MLFYTILFYFFSWTNEMTVLECVRVCVWVCVFACVEFVFYLLWWTRTLSSEWKKRRNIYSWSTNVTYYLRVCTVCGRLLILILPTDGNDEIIVIVYAIFCTSTGRSCIVCVVYILCALTHTHRGGCYDMTL